MDDYSGSEKPRKTSPCLYMVLGCGLAVVLAIVAVIAVGTLLARKGQKFAESMSDPAARAEKVGSILGTEDFPEGYYPMLGVSIPFVMDLAMLTDQEPDPGGEPREFSEHGFVYIDSRAFSNQRQDLIDYLEGVGGPPDFFDNVKVDVELDFQHPVQRGRFDVDGIEHIFAVYRGEFDTRGESIDGLQILTYVECDDDRLRLGINFGPDPGGSAASVSEPAEALGLAPDSAPNAKRQKVEATLQESQLEKAESDPSALQGSEAADPAALVDFYRHFSLCR